MDQLDARISELSQKYLPLAVEMLREVIRIPADYVNKPLDQGGDPECGLSNHEGPRLEYLRNKIIEIGGVRSEEDIGFDEYGNLAWMVSDPNTVASLLRRMEKAGWINRRPRPNDLRAKEATPTKNGLRIFAEARSHALSLEKTVLASLSEQEQEIFLKLLEKVADACMQKAARAKG